MQHDYDLSTKIDRLERLVNALRSDQYTQTTSKLRTQYGFCCLGVACDIYGLDVGGGFWRETNYRSPLGHIERQFDFVIHDEREIKTYNGSTLPGPVAQAFGFDRDDPSVEGAIDRSSGVTPSLATLNDTGFTFIQIADVIEYFFLNPLRAYNRPSPGQKVRIVHSQRHGHGIVGTVVAPPLLPTTWLHLLDSPHAFIIEAQQYGGMGYMQIGFMDEFEVLDQ